jgi:transposase
MCCVGKQVYAARHREQWLSKIAQVGVHRRAELFYQQLDGLLVLRNTVRGELLAESQKHQAVKILRQVPSIGPLRAALLLALMQTPHRFRSKRQLWTYSGLAVVTHDSAPTQWPRSIQGDAAASPFRYLRAEPSNRERHQCAKSWGCGGKPPTSIRCRRRPP